MLKSVNETGSRLVAMHKKLDMLLFAGTSNQELASEIAKHLNISLGKAQIDRFPDGEIALQILDNVRGKEVFVMQSVALDPNNYLMELLIMIDSLKRAAAHSIVVILPYYGYCRQDRRDRPRVPITAKLVADLLEKAGATQILTMDLHTDQLQGFFDIPVDNLYGRYAIVEAIKNLPIGDLMVVTPDIGSIKLARSYASLLDVDFAIIDKHRKSAEEVEVTQVIGNVEEKDVLLADDMCSTGSTLLSAAKACREKGARRIFAAVTHGLFTNDALAAIDRSDIDVLFVSNSILQKDTVLKHTELHVVSVAPLFAQAVRHICLKKSITSLFEKNK